jgi:hypothetical protein
MSRRTTPFPSPEAGNMGLPSSEDFLSPKERMAAIAALIADIALDSLRKNHEHQTPEI